MAQYGLLGESLSHSCSPLLYKHFGIPDYALFEVPREEVAPFIHSCARKGIKGLNVTIPYKKTAMACCDVLSDTAHATNNVNTLRFLKDGRIYGHNTDYFGVLQMLKTADISLQDKKVVILGTGGAAETVRVAAGDLMAAEIIQISRTGPYNYNNLQLQADAQVIINCTPVGMFQNGGAQPVSLDGFPHLTGVVDLIYNPCRTQLLLEAEKRRIPCTGGLSMLCEQARAAARVFLMREIGQTETVCAQREALRTMRNIVLVGMPGSGKTTVGRVVAQKTGRAFLDTDELILQKVGRTSAAIIEAEGEAAFRAVEAEVLFNAVQHTGTVIATGGGAVLDERNRDAIRRTGRVYWLKRPLRELSTEDRPLSFELKVLYEKRKEAYTLSADAAVEAAGDAESTADLVIREWEAAL